MAAPARLSLLKYKVQISKSASKEVSKVGVSLLCGWFGLVWFFSCFQANPRSAGVNISYLL